MEFSIQPTFFIRSLYTNAMRQLFNCFKTWSCSSVEQMQRTQLIIFFFITWRTVYFSTFIGVLNTCTIKFKLNSIFHFFVNDTNDRSFYTCYKYFQPLLSQNNIYVVVHAYMHTMSTDQRYLEPTFVGCFFRVNNTVI